MVLFSRSDRLEFWLNGSRPTKTLPRIQIQKLGGLGTKEDEISRVALIDQGFYEL